MGTPKRVAMAMAVLVAGVRESVMVVMLAGSSAVEAALADGKEAAASMVEAEALVAAVWPAAAKAAAKAVAREGRKAAGTERLPRWRTGVARGSVTISWCGNCSDSANSRRCSRRGH